MSAAFVSPSMTSVRLREDGIEICTVTGWGPSDIRWRYESPESVESSTNLKDKVCFHWDTQVLKQDHSPISSRSSF